MRVRKVNSEIIKLSETTKVKLKTTGNTQVVQFAVGNNKKCPVKNLFKRKQHLIQEVMNYIPWKEMEKYGIIYTMDTEVSEP